MNPVSIYQSGRILSSTEGAQVQAWTKSAIEREVRYLLLDLSGTSFMDSSGLGAIVIASKHARQKDVKFALCSLNGQARMLLELSSMETHFEIFSDRQAFDQHLREVLDRSLR